MIRLPPRRLPLAVAAAALPLLDHAAGAAAPSSPPLPDATAASAIAALHLSEATETRLENGLTVVLEENHQSPFVAMYISYDAGSRSDGAGKEGLTAITQRMMVSATKHVPTGVRDAALERIGAYNRDWSTELDRSSEWATVPSNAVDTVLWLWSDQMGFFEGDDPRALADAVAAKAKERAKKVTGAPLGAVGEIVEHALYPEGHPYHAMPLGESREHLTLDDVRALHDAYFAPNDAVLVLVGDFQPAAVLDRVRAYFGPIAPGPKRPAPLEPVELDKSVRLEVAADVKAPAVWMDWRTPAFFAAGDAELDVAARAMVGTYASVLYWDLVSQQRAATHVSARQMSHALGSDFRITATVAPGHGTEEVIARIDRVLRNAEERGLSEPNLVGVRDEMIFPRIAGFDAAANRARDYMQLATAHRDPRLLLGDLGRYDAVTVASTRATMLRWLSFDHRVVTVVTPDPSAPVSGILRTSGGAK
jgi:predicted Zn-dependent peptidase